jgi:hypothetical protein
LTSAAVLMVMANGNMITARQSNETTPRAILRVHRRGICTSLNGASHGWNELLPVLRSNRGTIVNGKDDLKHRSVRVAIGSGQSAPMRFDDGSAN